MLEAICIVLLAALLIGLLPLISRLVSIWRFGARPSSVSAKRVLIIVAHPDDETLACGGLITRLNIAGASIKIIVATDGNKQSQGKIRRQELRGAMSALGIFPSEWSVLDYEDGEVVEQMEDLRQRLITVVSDFGPDLIITHSMSDIHPDHRAVALSTYSAAMETPILHFPMTDDLFGLWVSPRYYQVALVKLSNVELMAKKIALKHYRSQTCNPFVATVYLRALLPWEIFLQRREGESEAP